MFQVIYKIQKEDMNVGNHVGNEKSLVFLKKLENSGWKVTGIRNYVWEKE
ncbi:hypothetical protein C095_06040 [Fusobacterium necrophorum subsp. funduliforme B35]|uniref:Uncharacterized protein n=1 Tax=Fusobacterium necrophorum subsp. funduliforme B35 TaxID=1226633 RepID=A0A0B4EQG0_9FUSO|nr:hypothetical protein C095_06040 [Fusobacterium necrophorum subsp. funduliforme B35]